MRRPSFVQKSLHFSDHLDENRGRNDIAYALCKHSALKGYTADLPFEKTRATAVSRIDSCVNLNAEIACTRLTIFNPVDSGDHTDRDTHTSMKIEECDDVENLLTYKKEYVMCGDCDYLSPPVG